MVTNRMTLPLELKALASWIIGGPDIADRWWGAEGKVEQPLSERDQVQDFGPVQQQRILCPAEPFVQGVRERIRDVRDGPDGALWLLTDNNAGRILRVTPAK